MMFKLNGTIYSGAKINGNFIKNFSLNDYIIINNNTIQNLTYYYANDDGILNDYSEIANIPSNGRYTFFNGLNTVPGNATRIIGMDITNTIKDEVSILSLKKNIGEKLYSVGLLSDIHIDGNGDGNDSDSGNSQSDFTNALEYFKNKGVDFICIDGDITYYGYDADYQAYKSLISNYSIPIKAIRGNHECYVNGSSNYDYTNTKFQEYIGELYYEYIHGEDIYLFCGMYQEDSSNPFSNNELTWLSNKLEEHKNERVFLFVHYYYGETGNANHIVSIHRPISDQTFIDLITNYKNVIYFSGHTHLAFYLQQYSKDNNVKMASDICHRVHIPSCSKPRKSSTGEEGSYSNYFEGSEGILMEVYEKGILLKGINFETNKFVPIASYYLETKI